MITDVCRRLGKGVLALGLGLAGLMLAVGTSPATKHTLSTGQTLGAVAFVALSTVLVGGSLLLVGRRTRR
jgi:uncharacterized membrane protein YhhN